MTIRHLAYCFSPDILHREMATFLALPSGRQRSDLLAICTDPIHLPIIRALRVETKTVIEDSGTIYGAFLSAIHCFSETSDLGALSGRQLGQCLDFVPTDSLTTNPLPNPARGRPLDKSIFKKLKAPLIASAGQIPAQAGYLSENDISRLLRILDLPLEGLEKSAVTAIRKMLLQAQRQDKALLLLIDQ